MNKFNDHIDELSHENKQDPLFKELAEPMTVIRRSAIVVTPHKYGYRYQYTVTLENGTELDYEGYANTRDKAIDNALTRSANLIEHGYRGWESGLGVETFGSSK
jgi:hypothetical protein